MAPDGRPVPEFLLHIEGADAWLRWSDEPFSEGEGEPQRPRPLMPRIG